MLITEHYPDGTVKVEEWNYEPYPDCCTLFIDSEYETHEYVEAVKKGDTGTKIYTVERVSENKREVWLRIVDKKWMPKSKHALAMKVENE